MRRSSEADRAGANDNNGKIGAGHGIHSSVLPASWNCGSKKEITQRVATSLALPTQPLSAQHRSEEHTSELQSLMRISYAVFCLKKKRKQKLKNNIYTTTNINTVHKRELHQ